jgi:hypothetical protein
MCALPIILITTKGQHRRVSDESGHRGAGARMIRRMCPTLEPSVFRHCGGGPAQARVSAVIWATGLRTLVGYTCRRQRGGGRSIRKDLAGWGLYFISFPGSEVANRASFMGSKMMPGSSPVLLKNWLRCTAKALRISPARGSFGVQPTSRIPRVSWALFQLQVRRLVRWASDY